MEMGKHLQSDLFFLESRFCTRAPLPPKHLGSRHSLLLTLSALSGSLLNGPCVSKCPIVSPWALSSLLGVRCQSQVFLELSRLLEQ